MTWWDVLAVVAGFGAGSMSGTMGVGGGLLFVPQIPVGFGLSQAVAQGTSLVVIIPTAIVGGITHLRNGNVLVRPALWMGGGGVVGAVLGALVAGEVPGAILAPRLG